MPTEPNYSLAGDREAGVPCRHCSAPLAAGDPTAVCRECGKPHHKDCWVKAGGCASYSCAPARREPTADMAPAIRISAAELEAVKPLAPRPPFGAPAAPPPLPPGAGKLALSGVIVALAGLAGLGAMLTVSAARPDVRTLRSPEWWFVAALFAGAAAGLAAIILGGLALGGARARSRQTFRAGAAGVLVGLGGLVGWVIFAACTPWAEGGAKLANVEFHADAAAMNLEKVEPRIARALAANVLIESAGGSAGGAVGSGVILQIKDGEALIVTNRHVLDPEFESSPAAPSAEKIAAFRPDVKVLGQPGRPGRVIWVAPDGIDLALVRAPCGGDQARSAKWARGRLPPVAASVFAIGNPLHLDWTYTDGKVSRLAERDCGPRKIRIVQTQTPITFGNSGGGLYDAEGWLIGINTWTVDKRAGDGISFAIGLDSLLDLSPAGLETPATEGR